MTSVAISAHRRPSSWLEIGSSVSITEGEDLSWLETGSSVSMAREEFLRHIEDYFLLREQAKIQAFLRDHPQLMEIVLEAVFHIERHFGPDPQVELAVSIDPEIEGMEELFAYICTSLPVDEALARLDRLDEEWFLEQLDRVNGLFNINLKFL